MADFALLVLESQKLISRKNLNSAYLSRITWTYDKRDSKNVEHGMMIHGTYK